MEIKQINENKKQFLGLLLLADEQEDMIDRYLERGDLFALYDGGLKSVCVVTDEGAGVYEIKNLATYPEHQGKGYGRAIVEYVSAYYAGKGKKMLVGTGDGTQTVRFYEKCGFQSSHRVEGFFTDNYDHPMFEDGVQLKDMIYLEKEL